MSIPILISHNNTINQGMKILTGFASVLLYYNYVLLCIFCILYYRLRYRRRSHVHVVIRRGTVQLMLQSE